MRWLYFYCLLIASVSLLAAQSTPAPSSAGVTAEWDVRKLLDSLALQTKHIQSVVDSAKSSGLQAAPEAYVVQWKTAQTELNYLLTSINNLSHNPERLPLALDTLFRMQALEGTLGAVFEGIRKYQNPALADLLQAIVNENSTNRDRLRQYVQDLAVQKEQEFQVADREAQRCRANLVHQPADNVRGRRP